MEQFLMLSGAVALLTVTLKIIGSAILPAREVQVRNEFGSLDAVNELGDFYRKIASGAVTSQLFTMDESWTQFLKTKRIPKSLLPKRFVNHWSYNETDERFTSPFMRWPDVVAYFDRENRLVGIEFAQSRLGCFISDNPGRCPPWFDSLHRIANDGNIIVTARVMEDHEEE